MGYEIEPPGTRRPEGMRYEITRVLPSITGPWETSETATRPHSQKNTLSALNGAKSIAAHRALGRPGVTFRVREVQEGEEVSAECPLLYEARLEARDYS